MISKPVIGFIGQGWIGKHYADNFEARDYEVIRYAKEPPYDKNAGEIERADIVFIAVPTPTTIDGFDYSIVQDVVRLVGKGKIAVIKSTLLPGTTERIQSENGDLIVNHSPEFLTETSAKSDVASPFHNIVGISIDSLEHRDAARLVLSVLPSSNSQLICSSREAEIFKYLRNNYLYTKFIFLNIYFDIAKSFGVEWDNLRDLIASDPWLGNLKFEPVHKGGRGVGNHCHIKDFATMRRHVEENLAHNQGIVDFFKTIEGKNIELLVNSGKDLDLLKGVYGDKVFGVVK